MEVCENCKKKIEDYAAASHRCGHFLGWPNYRSAYREREVLVRRYNEACTRIADRGLDTLREEVERLADAARPAVTMPAEVCDQLLRGGKYRSYGRRVILKDRPPAPEIQHSDRTKVDETIYPGYGQHLQYAVLSPAGRALLTYGGGEAVVTWGVTTDYLGLRATLLEENGFTYYSRHRLGDIGAVPPRGYRAVWEDRAKLAVAKIAPLLSPSIGADEIIDLMLLPGKDRPNDEFIEVAMYGEDGIDGQDVERVQLKKPRTSDERFRMGLIQSSCRKRGIEFVVG